MEDVHHLHLKALLHDLVREKGRLSRRVGEAVECGLQSGAGAGQTERPQAQAEARHLVPVMV